MTPTTVIGVYEGSLRVKIGTTAAKFRGEVRLAYDGAAMQCTVEGRAIDEKGQSRAVATGIVSASGVDTTVLRVEGSFSVTGPLEAVANTAGVAAARTLLASFAASMARLLTAEGLPAPDAEAIPIVEPETVARQVRAVAAQNSRRDDAATPRWGLLGRLRQIVPSRR